MKNCLKIFGITALAQMIMWIQLIAGDYIQENLSYNIGDLVWFFSILIFPVIYSIIYIKSDKNKTQKIKRFIITAGFWIIENVIICAWVWTLIEVGNWFIEQGTEILNGLEYFMCPISWTIIPIIIVLGWKLICLLYNKIKAIVK